MTIKISVALWTKRTGNIDIYKYNLMNQTFPKSDFEFIIVDELYEKRHDVIEEYFKGSGINLVHVNASKENHPKWKPWSWTATRSRNLALAYAKGEVLCLYDDYWYLTPKTLEAVWAAWDKWGIRGLCVPMMVPAYHCLVEKPVFVKYAKASREKWDERGGSDNLDAPPDTHISIYTEDFSEDSRPTLAPGWIDKGRNPAKIVGEMRDPRPDDPPELKEHHAGEAGGFHYWKVPIANTGSMCVPVAQAVVVNGWNDCCNGNFGWEWEIDERMYPVFNHRHVSTRSAFVFNFQHAYWGFDNPIILGKVNSPTSVNRISILSQLQRGFTWADNPFNMTNERLKVRRGEPTLIF